MQVIQVLIALAGLGAVSVLIIKKYNPQVVLMAVGVVLMFIAVLLGNNIFPPDGAGTGINILDPFRSIQQSFISQLGAIGLTIMALFGFSTYMTYIGANNVTVNALIKPVKKIKSVYFLVPVVFIVGNMLSLVVPSASALALLLMATLYPTLKGTGMSTLTAGGVIAMTATIMPTPLGADNILVAELLGIDLMTYVFGMHAAISIPSLLIMAIAHFFWQRYMDKKNPETLNTKDIASESSKKEQERKPGFYGIFPVLPLIILLLLFFFQNLGFMQGVTLDVVTVTLISFFIALITEGIRKKSFKQITEDGQIFFNGMGEGMGSVVSLVVSAVVLAEGFRALGVIDMVTNAVHGVPYAGNILSLVFTGATTLIGIVSGGGLAFFYAIVGTVPDIAAGAGIEGAVITLPMQMAANLSRTLSPVAAVVVIVAGSVKCSPMDILKRTIVPTVVGLVSVMILSFLILS
ncbi:MAG: C4-dicarboxylate transporter DcuC [Defluviitaleaceae bacterium]|nr:C4-dicarboxylate transporter DcuC [Defluviitaleaceae bacterium]